MEKEVDESATGERNNVKSLAAALRRIEAMDESEGAHIALSRAKRVARGALGAQPKRCPKCGKEVAA